jgi:uncharacterized integral membrane protein (TIGR00698 family)
LIEALVLALLFGVAARAVIPTPARFAPGAAYAATTLLELGVGLLGASVDAGQLLAAGPSLLVLVLAGVALGILVSRLVGHLLHLSGKLALLVAVGNSICGNSAIAAVAPVIRASAQETATAIALTGVLGVCLVLLLPLAVGAFGLSNYQYGVLAGMSVYAVPQVIAAAFPVSQLSGEVATLVKLARVALIGPVVLLCAAIYRPTADSARPVAGGWTRYVPWFMSMFVVLAIIRNLGLLPSLAIDLSREASRLLTVLAMAGLGFGVDLTAVRRVGLRVGIVVVLSLLFMAALTLVLMRLLAVQ